ncbi:hypothetical protein R1T16_18330 [Flavobacterium sp. DG1-102-2]|uniref:hypothetical protein n=1 Tax=Flavobacterium sp. DG1-102-2 TaxID=3081663 RepID=UPI002949EFBC|nr:hypothetical protein [Flavobacterium sp. DG1-102-2]MDV6170399.1 hypothetical protein [Flavobacterium sp. DG1-102-2]
MKIDRYTKIVLTIIAVCLLENTIEKLDIFPKAYAGEASATANRPSLELARYGLIPVNKDGSINVTMKTVSPMDVNITGIRTSDDLKVNVSGINTSSSLNVNVNLDKISGSSVYGGLPIKVIK